LALADTKGGWVSEDRSPFQTYLQIAATIVGILAVVVPAGIWVADHLGSKATPASAGAAETQATSPAASTSTMGAAGPAPANVVFLDSLRPDTGGTNLAALPRALSGQPGYDHPVTIPCGSNNVGDQRRSVTYVLSRRYLSFHAVVRPYKTPPDESQVQVKAFPDSQPATPVTMAVNGAGQELSLNLDGVNKLTIELTCELPGAVVVLADASLVHV
jgi:hypothetical protein